MSAIYDKHDVIHASDLKLPEGVHLAHGVSEKKVIASLATARMAEAAPEAEEEAAAAAAAAEAPAAEADLPFHHGEEVAGLAAAVAMPARSWCPPRRRRPCRHPVSPRPALHGRRPWHGCPCCAIRL